MAFLKIQKLRKDEQGRVTSGSASILTTVYDRDRRGHSRHSVRERLGKVIAIDDDGRSGIFLSPVRGLISYDATTDTFAHVAMDDPRILDVSRLSAPPVHASFGDVYLFVTWMEKNGWLSILRKAFPEDEMYERVLAHVIHVFLKDESHIKCDTLIEQSAVSHILPDLPVESLRSDIRFFDAMGDDNVKRRYFQDFVSEMRIRNRPGFGSACYVDSSPLPNDEHKNPYNALRCEGKAKGCSLQMRMSLVLDDQTDLPVWFEIMPGTIVDVSTLNWVVEDVWVTLGIAITNVVVDAGYVSREMLQQFCGRNGRALIARMPARSGYPYLELYEKYRHTMEQTGDDILREGHTYFAVQHKLELFGVSLNAYVFVDRQKASCLLGKFREKHEAEFQKMDKHTRDWYGVRFGYFVLLSNLEEPCEEILRRYVDRVSIEKVFKTGKSFLDLLPLAKWTAQRVRGKVLLDMIDTTIRSQMTAMFPELRVALMDLFHAAAAVGCIFSGDDIIVDPPTRTAKDAYTVFGFELPANLSLKEWRQRVLHPPIQGANRSSANG